MARDLNRVQLIGRLGQDPELRYTPNGHAVASWSLAVNTRKKQGGDWVDDTTWVKCVAWRDLAEQVGQLTKGTAMYIEGKLSNRQYVDKDGITRYVTEVIASTAVQLLWLKAGQAEGLRADSWSEPSAGATLTEGDDMGLGEEELPF